MRKTTALLILFCSTLMTSVLAAERPTPRLVSVKRIWDKGKHNAFTDLLFHEGRWYCVFREGSKHVSPDGSLRVIVSDLRELQRTRAYHPK